ncbi:MAG: hypothetical protein Q8Q38_01720 [bacterium]|nr:hypothetical protein [bacterium]MDZ4231689.1 hypothetical protein [Candidatus Pacearchaeota archaeon]
MAITFTGQRKLQQNLAIAVGFLVLLTLLVAWWGFIREPGPSAVETIIPPPRTLEMNFGVLDSAAFLEIAEPSAPVTIPEQVGRENPFLPL